MAKGSSCRRREAPTEVKKSTQPITGTGWRSEAFSADVQDCLHSVSCLKNPKAAGVTLNWLRFQVAPSQWAGVCVVVNDTKPGRQVRCEKSGTSSDFLTQAMP